MIQPCEKGHMLSRCTVTIYVSMAGVGDEMMTFVRGNGVPRDL